VEECSDGTVHKLCQCGCVHACVTASTSVELEEPYMDIYLPIILKPLLFLIDINGLPSATTCSSTYLFADGANSSGELLVITIPSSSKEALPH